MTFRDFPCGREIHIRVSRLVLLRQPAVIHSLRMN